MALFIRMISRPKEGAKRIDTSVNSMRETLPSHEPLERMELLSHGSLSHVLYTFVWPPLPLLVKDVPEKTRKDLLNETMKLVLSNLKINYINKVDLIFIPIFKSEHVFLLVLDLKTPSFELFDNMVPGDEHIDRYEQIPTLGISGGAVKCVEIGKNTNGERTNRDIFVNYLVDNDHPNAYKLHQKTTKILDLPWKTIENGEDCGVFCMRHMET
ncbi:hypothetical protein R6Q59_012159 [Mikania micrantha]